MHANYYKTGNFWLLLFLVFHLNAQVPFDCNGRMYRVLEEQGGTTFQEVHIEYETEKVFFEDLQVFRGTRINGIAYCPADNLIYGVLLEAPYQLCRIDAEYRLERLAPLPLPSEMLFVSGDISPNERYLVLLGFSPDESGNLLALVDLESPTYETTIVPVAKTNPNEDVYCADIAFHPTLDILFGFEHSTNRLITIDINTGLVDNTSYPEIEVIQGNMPTIFFDAFGNLFGVANAEGVYSNRNLYQFDIDNGSAYLFEDMGFERNQDGCSCPFKVKLLNRVSQRTTFPCTSLEFEFTLLNRTDREQLGLRLTDTFPEGMTITAIDDLPFSGEIISGIGTNILDIQDIELPITKTSFKITLDIAEGTPPELIYNRAHLDGVLFSSLFETERISSDDPETARPDDPTFFRIDNIAVQFGNQPPVLCPGSSLSLNAGVAGANYQWSTGASSQIIDVDTPGNYSVTITSGCEETSGNIDVIQENISLDLGPDRQIERGEQIKLIPDFESSVPILSYYWEASRPDVLPCVTCPTTEIAPLSGVDIQLTIENEWGCQAQDEVAFTVGDSQWYMPNAFSPNGDHVNDRFFLQSRIVYQIESFQIFDRWGALLFENRNISSNDANAGWDGTSQNKDLDTGVYVWVAQFKALDGELQVASGDVMLMR